MKDALRFAHLPGIVSFLQTVFPGGSSEPKRYAVRGYTLIHAPLTIEKDQKLFALIERAGGTSWDDFLNSTLKDVLVTLFKEGFIHDFLEIVLEFEDPSWWARVKRLIRMRLTFTTKRELVGQLNNAQVEGEIIPDFFMMNLSSMQRSSGLSSSTTSSSKSPGVAAESSPTAT